VKRLHSAKPSCPFTHAWATCHTLGVPEGEYAYGSWGMPPLESGRFVMKMQQRKSDLPQKKFPKQVDDDNTFDHGLSMVSSEQMFSCLRSEEPKH